MADVKKGAKPQAPPPPPPPKKKKFRRFFKFFALAIVLLILIGVGFAAGVYLKFINVPRLAEQYKLYNYPVIGGMFPKPAVNFEPLELEEEPEQAAQPPAPAAQPPVPPVAAQPPLTDAEKDKLAKAIKQEEAKRISRTARLYGAMKPDEAVPILNQLDDPTVISILSKMEDEQVAKILAQMDPKRAARLTDAMLKGQKVTPTAL